MTLEQPLTATPKLDRGLARARVSPSSAYGGWARPRESGAGGTSSTTRSSGGRATCCARGGSKVIYAERRRRHDQLVQDQRRDPPRLAVRGHLYAIGIGITATGVDRGALDKLTRRRAAILRAPARLDLEKAFDEIQNDLRQQYVLTYTPANNTTDGTFRKIEVKRAGEERGLRGSARRGTRPEHGGQEVRAAPPPAVRAPAESPARARRGGRAC